MGSLTKNKQSEVALRSIIEKCFAPLKMVSYKELTEGYFNVAYEVKLSDGKDVILKVAPLKTMRIMTYEKNIMHSEVSAMKAVEADKAIPAPRVLVSDEEGLMLGTPYFFMEKLEGKSLNSIKQQLTELQLHEIYKEVGRILYKVNQIECPCFGYPGQKDFQGGNWFSTFKQMLEAGIGDARSGKVDLKISIEALWKQLEKDRSIFEEVTIPRLVHWDCWDGNIFVADGKVTGIIDWERCLWADPLMEANMRTYADNTWFLEGYGKESWTKQEKRRALWYDVYQLLLMSLECEYRQYETMEMYDWASALLVQQFEKLVKSK